MVPKNKFEKHYPNAQIKNKEKTNNKALNKISLYIFYSILSIITLGALSFTIMICGNFQPDFVKTMITEELHHIKAKDVKISNKGTKFAIKLQDCYHYDIHIPEIKIEASIWNILKRGKTNISKIEIEMDTLNIEKNNEQFFILPNTKAVIQQQPLSINVLQKNYDKYCIEKIKVKSKYLNFKTQNNILKFHDINMNYDGEIDLDAKMMIDSLTSEIACKFSPNENDSKFKFKVKKFPFIVLKSILGLENQINFINDTITDCEIKGKIAKGNTLTSEFDMKLYNNFITLFENKLFYDTLKIKGVYDTGILNLTKISLKTSQSNFKAENIKISDEGIFFDSKINFKNINHDIINNFIKKLNLSNEYTNYLKIKKANLYVTGLLSQKLKQIPVINSGKIFFTQSRIILNNDFMLDNLIGNLEITAPNNYKISANTGILNQINHLESFQISKNPDKISVSISGNFEPSYILTSLDREDLFNMIDLNKLNGFWNGEISFSIPTKTRKTENVAFKGTGKFTYHDSYINEDTIQSIDCKLQSIDGIVVAKGNIKDINNHIITFNLDKKPSQKAVLTVRGTANPSYFNKLCGYNIFNQSVDIVDSIISRQNHNISSKFVLNIKNSAISVPVLDFKSEGENGLLNIECNETPYRKLISFSMNAKNSETNGTLTINNSKIKSFDVNVNGKSIYNIKGTLDEDIWKIDLAGDTIFLDDSNIFKENFNFDLAIDVNKCISNLLSKTPSRVSGFWKNRSGFVNGANLQINPLKGGQINIKASSNNKISEINISSENVGKIFKLIGISNENIIGSTQIKLLQRKNSDLINGDITIKNCIVKNSSTMQNLMTLLNLSQNNNVIGFSKIFGDFSFNTNSKIISLQNIQSKGPLLNIISIGTLNLDDKTINLKGKVTTNAKKQSKYTLQGSIDYPILDIF